MLLLYYLINISYKLLDLCNSQFHIIYIGYIIYTKVFQKDFAKTTGLKKITIVNNVNVYQY